VSAHAYEPQAPAAVLALFSWWIRNENARHAIGRTADRRVLAAWQTIVRACMAAEHGCED
jgi:hypothetical protein